MDRVWPGHTVYVRDCVYLGRREWPKEDTEAGEYMPS